MTTTLRLLSAVLMTVLLTGALVRPARGQTHLDTEAVDAVMREGLAAYDIPGASLAIVQDGDLLYAQGYGVRSLASGDPVSPATQFNIGSITKSFTALAAAQLADAGKLDLDAPITRYVPSVAFSDPVLAEQVTMRHLLSNSAGFAADDSGWYTGDSLDTMQAVIDSITERPMVAEPGTSFEYNNIGFTLAGYVLEQVAGRPWSEIMRDNILHPLEMTTATTTFEAMQALPDHAVPHLLDVLEGMQPAAFFDNMDAVAPAGAINASALEMANYALLQLGDGTFDGQRLVSAARLEELHTVQVGEYALGWAVADYNGLHLVLHNGSIDGFGALLVLVPERELGVVILMNADYDEQAGSLDLAALRIIDSVLGLETDAAVLDIVRASGIDPEARRVRLEAARSFEANPADLEGYAGLYTSSLGRLSVDLVDGRLTLSLDGGALRFDAVELVPFEPGRFIPRIRGLVNNVFEFQEGDDGSVRLLQDGIAIGRKPGSAGDLAVYSDPAGKFSVNFPSDLVIETRDNYLLATSAEPAGVFAVGSGVASGDLQADASAFAERLGTPVSEAPVSIRNLPGTQPITQYVWLLDDGSVLAVNVMTDMGTVYFVTVQAEQSVVQSLVGPMSEIMLGLTLNP